MTAPAVAPDDETLVSRALRSDDEAFAELVRRHKRRVFGLAARFTRNDHDLDEIAQETFIRAYRNLGTFRGEAPFAHWLSRLAVRACYDWLRRRKRRLPEFEGEHPPDPSAPPPQTEAIEIVHLALSKLAPEERLVLTLIELEGYPMADVAQLTGWSVANVKVRAHRARQALKKVLTQLQ